MKNPKKPGKKLAGQLQAFFDEFQMAGKGALSVALVVTRSAASIDPPFDEQAFLSPKGGQVRGLGGQAVQAILADHGISRVLAEEGGRTSRGSIERMRGYLALLNNLHRDDVLDFDAIEAWWIVKVVEHFAAEPLKVKVDASKSLRHIISELMKAAFARQEKCPGMMVAGAVMQHLVGAKLTVALPNVHVQSTGFTVADSPGGRKGDFLLHDTAIHVTTAPTEALLRKCVKNLAQNLRPVIITTEDGLGGAMALAKTMDLSERIDVLEIQQFIATNVYEWSLFQHQARPISLDKLIAAYNKIVDDCETDPSLRISVG